MKRYIILSSIQPGLFYLWQDGSTASSFHVTTAGVYFVEIKYAEGCYGYDTVNVEVGEPVIAAFDFFPENPTVEDLVLFILFDIQVVQVLFIQEQIFHIFFQVLVIIV